MVQILLKLCGKMFYAKEKGVFGVLFSFAGKTRGAVGARARGALP